MMILIVDSYVICVLSLLIKGVRDVNKFGIVLKNVRQIIGRFIKIHVKKSRNKHNNYYNNNNNNINHINNNNTRNLTN